MALLLKTMVQKYRHAMHDFHDKRTENFFLINSPIPVVFITTCYLVFVMDVGQKYMKGRKAFNIDKLLIAYNTAQVVLCLYTGIYFTPYVTGSDITCNTADFTMESLPAVHLGYIYFLTKIFDLLDTVFFVLRKKSKQVTFLHVYHHCIILLYSWAGIKYYPGGQLILIGWINSFVHVVMYFYYLLTVYDASYKTSVWWKKHITQLQLFQFATIGVWIALPLFNYDCKFPKIISFLLFPQLLAITCLFADFYYKTYIQRKPVKGITSIDVNQNTNDKKNKFN